MYVNLSVMAGHERSRCDEMPIPHIGVDDVQRGKGSEKGNFKCIFVGWSQDFWFADEKHFVGSKITATDDLELN
jgi:hypothetical protein